MLKFFEHTYNFLYLGIDLDLFQISYIVGFIWLFVSFESRNWRSRKYRKLVKQGVIGNDWTLDTFRPILFPIPILNEPVAYFRKVLDGLHQSIKYAKLVNYHIIIVFDGVIQDWSKEKQKEALGEIYELAARYDHTTIATGDQEAKRPNVTWAQKYAIDNAKKLYPEYFKKYPEYTTKNFIDEAIYAPMDSDAILEKNVLYETLRPFSADNIGGTTCIQQIGEVENYIQGIDAWMEDARAYEGAMCSNNLPRRFDYIWTGLMFGALVGLITAPFGHYVISATAGTVVWLMMSLFLWKRRASTGPQIVCNPGRLSAWRMRPIWDRREEFLHDPCFFSGTDRDPGDDRKHTNDMRDAGYDVMMTTVAKLHTTAVNTLAKWRKQKLRWRRTGNGYTIQDSWSLSRYPTAFGVAWNDIFIMIWTNFVVYSWVFRWLYGDAEGYNILIEFLLAYGGMVLTMFIRQRGHLRRHPCDIRLLFLFPFFATALQIIGLFALLTPCHMGWGHRTESAAKGKRTPLEEMRYTVLKA